MKKLRLLLWSDCDRNCKGCCNKNWNLKALPICRDFTDYKEILLTGGEPLLYPKQLKGIIKVIRNLTTAKIYLYTALILKERRCNLYEVLNLLDGITLTLHNSDDVRHFKWLLYSIKMYPNDFKNKSLKLNVFKEVGLKYDELDLSMWDVTKDIEWIKNCPLPKDEIFMRL